MLNENEHNTGAERYTKCFDEIHKAVRAVNPTIFFAGPEGTGYTDYLIDPKNHEGGDASLIPDILSLHQGFSASGESTHRQQRAGLGLRSLPSLVVQRWRSVASCCCCVLVVVVAAAWWRLTAATAAKLRRWGVVREVLLGC